MRTPLPPKGSAALSPPALSRVPEVAAPKGAGSESTPLLAAGGSSASGQPPPPGTGAPSAEEARKAKPRQPPGVPDATGRCQGDGGHCPRPELHERSRPGEWDALASAALAGAPGSPVSSHPTELRSPGPPGAVTWQRLPRLGAPAVPQGTRAAAAMPPNTDEISVGGGGRGCLTPAPKPVCVPPALPVG